MTRSRAPSEEPTAPDRKRVVRIDTVRRTAPTVGTTDSTQPAPQDTSPHPQTEIGPSEDMLVVYEGHVDGPLDRAPAWRYMTKEALHTPNVPAVEEFRKAIEEAEKQQKSKP